MNDKDIHKSPYFQFQISQEYISRRNTFRFWQLDISHCSYYIQNIHNQEDRNLLFFLSFFSENGNKYFKKNKRFFLTFAISDHFEAIVPPTRKSLQQCSTINVFSFMTQNFKSFFLINYLRFQMNLTIIQLRILSFRNRR